MVGRGVWVWVGKKVVVGVGFCEEEVVGGFEEPVHPVWKRIKGVKKIIVIHTQRFIDHLRAPDALTFRPDGM